MKLIKGKIATSVLLTFILIGSPLLNSLGIVRAETDVQTPENEEQTAPTLLSTIGVIGNQIDTPITGQLSKKGKVFVYINKSVDGTVVKIPLVMKEDVDGNMIVTDHVVTDDDGNFDLVIKKQLANAKITFEFTDMTGNYKTEKMITVQNTAGETANTTPPVISQIDPAYNTGKIIKGTVSKPGSVTATIGSKIVGTTTVLEKDKMENGLYPFEVVLSEFPKAVTSLTLQAKDLTKPTPLLSSIVNVEILKDESSLAWVTGKEFVSLSDADTYIEGQVKKPATINVSINETIVSNLKAETDVYGNFKISIPKQPVGTVVQLILTDAANKELKSVEVVVKDKTNPVIKNISSVYDTSTFITGEVSEASIITIQESTDNGTNWSTIASDVRTDENNKFTFLIPDTKEIEAKTLLRFTAKDYAEPALLSDNFEIQVKEDKKAPLLTSNMITVDNQDETIFEGKLNEAGYVDAVVNGTSILTPVGPFKTESDGTFKVTLDKQIANTKITFLFTDKKGNESKRFAIVKDTTAIKLVYPTVSNAEIKNSMKTISGTINKPGIITATIGNKVIGKATIKENTKPDINDPLPEKRRYDFTIVLKEPLLENDVVAIQAVDFSKPKALESDIINLKVVDDDQPPALEGGLTIHDAMTTVIGKLDKPGTVQLLVEGTPLHTKVVNTDEYGNFRISIKKQPKKTEVTVKMTSLLGKTNTDDKIVVDGTVPIIKKVNTVYDTSKVITGQVSESSKVTATVDGHVIKSDVETDEVGNFNIELDQLIDKNKKIVLTADDDTFTSKAVTTVVKEDRVAPKLLLPKTVVLNNLDEFLEGQLSKAGTVDILDSRGNSIVDEITKATSADGTFKVEFAPQLANAKLTIVMSDLKAKPNVSKKIITVQDGVAPEVTVENDLYNTSKEINGTVTEPSKVTATVNGKAVGTVTVKESDKIGENEYKFSIPLKNYITAGTEVIVQAKDNAKPKANESIIVPVTVQKDEDKPALIEPFVIKDNQTIVEGYTDRVAIIQLFVDGTPLHQKPVTTDASGKFKITIKKQAIGTKITVRLSHVIDSTIHDEQDIFVQDGTAPTIKKVNTVYDSSDFIEGQLSEKAKVYVSGEGFNIEEDSDQNGYFKVRGIPRLAAGSKITISAIDGDGVTGNKTAKNTIITVRADKTAPKLIYPKTLEVTSSMREVEVEVNEPGTVEVLAGQTVIIPKTPFIENERVKLVIGNQVPKTKLTFIFRDRNDNQLKKIVTVK